MSRSPGFARVVLAGVTVLCLAAPLNVARTAPAEPDRSAAAPQLPGSQQLRAMLDRSNLAAAEAGARMVLAATTAATHQDSLQRSDALGVLVEALLREGRSLEPDTRTRAEALVALRVALLPPGHADVATAHELAGFVLRDLHLYSGARQHMEIALKIRETAFGAQHPETAKSLSNLGTVLFKTSEYAKARDLFKRALEIQQKTLPPEDPGLAATMFNLAWARTEMHDTTDVRVCFVRALVIWQKALGPEDPRVAFALHHLGTWQMSRGDYAGAAQSLERAQQIRDRVLPNTLDLAATLKERARLLVTLGDLETARPLIDRAEGICQEKSRPDDPELADCLLVRGDLLQQAGSFPDAKRDYERALAMLDRSLPPGQPERANIMQSLAAVEIETGSFARAESLFKQAIAIKETAYGPDDVEVALARVGYARVLRSTADFARARQENEQALTALERALGPDDVLVAGALTGLAGLLKDTGELARARTLAERAVTVREHAFGADHVQVAEALDGLALLLKSMGDLPAARQKLERALAIMKRRNVAETPEAANIMNGLGLVQRLLGRTTEARDLFSNALEIWERTRGPDHPSVAVVLQNLGSLANQSGDYITGRVYFERALAIREKRLGPDHPDVAATLIGLANAWKGRRDYKHAEPLYRRAIAIHEKAFGRTHPVVAVDLHNLAGLLIENDAIGAALDTALVVEEITREHFRLMARSLSEREALHYAAVRVKGLDMALTCAARASETSAARRVWDSVIRSRALVLDEMAVRRRTIAGVRDTGIVRLATQLAQASDQLANLTVRGRGALPVERYRALLDDADRARDLAERALAVRSEVFRQQQARGHVGFDEVAGALPQGTALVAYVRYDRLEESADDSAPRGRRRSPGEGRPIPAYLAFVATGPRSNPVIVPLAAASHIDSLVTRWHQEAAKGPLVHDPAEAMNAYQAAGRALRAAVWDSVAARLGGATRVLMVPDGAITLVNFAALPTDADAFLLESGPLLQTLSAERDLVAGLAKGPEGGGLLVAAGPDFERGDAEPLAPGRRRGTECRLVNELRFEPLPGTLAEEQSIVLLWRKYHERMVNETASKRNAGRRQATIFELVGPAASERAFKQNAPGRSVLHLATHGFFMSDACSPAETDPDPFASDDEPARPSTVEDNPLLLSGLALAGANARAGSGSNEEDGILTAEEISALDLSGVDWAVLSACETGAGKVLAGEGVLGLRRAFQVAGARTLIMSLWAVDDRAAAQWMEALYDHRLKRRQPTPEAVREACMDLLRARRAKGLSPHPFYWAPFVASGTWN